MSQVEVYRTDNLAVVVSTDFEDPGVVRVMVSTFVVWRDGSTSYHDRLFSARVNVVDKPPPLTWWQRLRGVKPQPTLDELVQRAISEADRIVRNRAVRAHKRELADTVVESMIDHAQAMREVDTFLASLSNPRTP